MARQVFPYRIAEQPAPRLFRALRERHALSFGECVAALLEQCVRILAGEAPFEIVEVGTQFGSQFLRFLEFATHRFDAGIERFDLVCDGVANLL